MAGLKKSRRIQLVLVASVLLIVATGLVIFAARDAFQFFRTPSDLTELPPRQGEIFKLGGLVKEGTWVSEGPEHRFVVTDTVEDTPVIYVGLLPDLFREGQGTIVTGQIQNEVFQATEVLARHDEDYMPKEVADALKEKGIYKPDDI